MNKKVFILLGSMLFCSAFICAQENAVNESQQRAETEAKAGNIAAARYNYIRAFEDYANKGETKSSVECGVKATELYYSKENYYKEAFELLHRVEYVITSSQQSAAAKAALQYQVTNQRLQMYMKLRKSDSAKAQLDIMEAQAKTANDEALNNDLLYTKTIYYYTFGQNDKGDAAFKEMAGKLTAQKEYDKVEGVYKTLIANGRRSNNANIVHKAYQSYVVWKDSVSALKTADEIGALKQQIAENEKVIAEKDGSLATRGGIITALCILAVVLAATIVVGAVVLMRIIFLNRRHKKMLKTANENNALKAMFISNISAQMEPTLQKLDPQIPEVKALQAFSQHIQTLSALETTMGEQVEVEEVQIPKFCEGLLDQVRDKVKANVTVHSDVPNMTTRINVEYVSHILLHLLRNAAKYAPEGGRVTLEYKKRSAHKCQFLVSNTGEVIPEEKREDVFKPFLELKDLTTGDGLGLPICKQMALKMNGDLEIDPEYTRGTRFVLCLYE